MFIKYIYIYISKRHTSNFHLTIYLRLGNHNLNKCGFGFRFNNFPNVIAHPYEKLVHSSVAISKINY